MWNDENWKPWEQNDLQYRPVRPVHYRPPRSSTPYSFFSSSSHQPSTSSSTIYGSFHPYTVPTRPIPPYLRQPSFFNTEFTSPRISYQRNIRPSLNRSDSWISRPAPSQLTNEDSWVPRGFPSKSSDMHRAFPLNSSENFQAFPTRSTYTPRPYMSQLPDIPRGLPPKSSNIQQAFSSSGTSRAFPLNSSDIHRNFPSKPADIPRDFTSFVIPRALPPKSTDVQQALPPPKVVCKPIEVILYARKSSKECLVHWQDPGIPSQYAQSKIIKVYENERLIDTVKIDQDTNEYLFATQPGGYYTCELLIRNIRGINTAEGRIKFRAIFSKQEMSQLLKKACDYVSLSRTKMHPFRVLYRCKPQCYWDDIQGRTDNMMIKYLKDDNGQAANPTNGNIFGLFFSARLLPNGRLPFSSPFGNIRMMLPAETLLDPKRVNLYFSDFYCNKLTHYVTVIICVKGTQSDEYCKEKLVPLATSNPFIKIVCDDNRYKFYCNKRVWVEIYFTENVPLSWGKFDRVIPTGLGTSRLGGLPHNKSCTACNLQPLGQKESDAYDYEDQYNEEEDGNEMKAKENLEKMIASMENTGLPTQDCEDIVFLVNDLVDHVVYDTDNSYTEKDSQTDTHQSETNGPSKKKGIASKIRKLPNAVSKRLGQVRSAIVKKKNQIKKKFQK